MAKIDRIWSRILHMGGHHRYNALHCSLHMHFLAFLGFQKGLICSYNGSFGAPREPPEVQKWVSHSYLVNIGQLDHYVVFGTKFGAVQDFQKGKKCPLGVQQTPLDPL